jgi:hypothetical protein
MSRRPLVTGYRPHYNDAFFRRLLTAGPFERRPRGGWRFGTKTISNAVVDRLLANNDAVISGDHVLSIQRQPS